MIHSLQPKYKAEHDPSHERTAIDEKSDENRLIVNESYDYSKIMSNICKQANLQSYKILLYVSALPKVLLIFLLSLDCVWSYGSI